MHHASLRRAQNKRGDNRGLVCEADYWLACFQRNSQLDSGAQRGIGHLGNYQLCIFHPFDIYGKDVLMESVAVALFTVRGTDYSVYGMVDFLRRAYVRHICAHAEVLDNFPYFLVNPEPLPGHVMNGTGDIHLCHSLMLPDNLFKSVHN